MIEKRTQFYVKNASLLGSKIIYYDLLSIPGLNWSFGIKKFAPYGMEIFFGYLRCTNIIENTHKVSCIIRMKTYSQDNVDYEEIKKHISYNNHHQVSCVLSVPWKNILEENRSLIHQDKLNIIITLIFHDIEEKQPLDYFFNSNLALADVVFIINKKKIYSHRQFLALHSDYFKAMFFSGFTESQRFEIPLLDVDDIQFVELLNLIYPIEKSSKNTINYSNVTYILELADRFSMPTIIRNCENFLLKDLKGIIPFGPKLMLAEKHRLAKLENQLIEEVTLPQIKELLRSKNHEELSRDSLINILDKILNFL